MSKNKTLSILLVEDNAADAELMDIVLKQSSLPFKLSVCEDGEQAMRYLCKQEPFQEAQQPDLILLDLNLPRKTGHEVLQAMRLDFHLQDIPVLVLTTTAQEKEIRRVCAYRNTRFFTKPFRFEGYRDVLSCIEDIGRARLKQTNPAVA